MYDTLQIFSYLIINIFKTHNMHALICYADRIVISSTQDAFGISSLLKMVCLNFAGKIVFQGNRLKSITLLKLYMEEVDNILVKFVILMIQDDNEVDILFLEVRKMQCQCNRLPELFIRVWLFSGFFESQKDIRMIITLLSRF